METVNDATHVSDAAGLDRAYASPNNVWAQGDTLFVSGTHEWGDVWDDVTLPFGGVEHSHRFAEAQDALTPNIRYVVGHSLGASVAGALVAKHEHLRGRVYARPGVRLTPQPRVESFRHYGDLISVFDRSAQHSLPHSLNPHGYH